MCWHKKSVCPSDGLRTKLQEAQEKLEAKDLRLGNLSDAAASFRRQRNAAIEQAEAAEALAERRLNCGLTLWAILKGIFERSGVKYIVREMAWLTLAEAQEED